MKHTKAHIVPAGSKRSIGRATLAFYCTFNGTYSDEVSGESGTHYDVAPGVADFHVMGKMTAGRSGKGLAFEAGAAGVDRIIYPVTITQPRKIAFGCRMRARTLFNGSDSRGILSLVDSGNVEDEHIKIYLQADIDGFSARFEHGGNARSLVVGDIALAVGDEIHVAVTLQPDPDETTGDRCIAKFFLNGTCVFQENLLTAYCPTTLNQLYIGNYTNSANYRALATISDVFVLDNVTLQDKHIWDIANGNILPEMLTDSRVGRQHYFCEGYSRTTLAYPVHGIDEFGRLWSISGGRVYYTGDSSGATGWTEFTNAALSSPQSLLVIDGYVFVSTPGILKRAAVADAGSPTWTNVLTTAGGDGGTASQYVPPGWGFTTRLAADGTRHIVIGEYRTPYCKGSRVIHSDDYFATNTVCYTSATDAGEQHHIHAVMYDSNGRLWCTRGDHDDNIGYSDDDGANWTWLLSEADHTNGAQCTGMCETADFIVCAVDQQNVNKFLLIHKSKDLHPFTGGTGIEKWNARWRAAGNAGGDEHQSAGWSCVTLPTGFVLCHERAETAGQKHGHYIMSPDGLVYIRLEALDSAVTASEVALCNNEWAFIGNHRIPATLRIGVR